ncbi:MAG: hypothetical protein IPJ65_00680 [Archangiaceae bacterium]|nr:hypothetical protein [Archangiaceae bacterium]
MVPRALLTAAFLFAGAAYAQQPESDYQYDADGDGDVDADDWQATQPPAPQPQSDSDFAPYPGEQAPTAAPTPQQFDAQLSPYGAWYDEPGVGRVWQPSPAVVGADFVPYTTGGNWMYTTAGWQFVSTYRFGSAPFHYGRWHRSPRFGWVWLPQYQWAPAWVDWRVNSAGNVAWAPLGPFGGVSFTFGAPYWSYAYGRYHRPHMSSFTWGRYGGWHGGHAARGPSYYRGGYGYRAPGYRAPSYSAPAYRAPPSQYRGAPQYRAPAPQQHRGGGHPGGGGHFGGGHHGRH